MPIGQQRYAEVAGFSGTPATMTPGESPFPATGADATAAPVELRNTRVILTNGVGKLVAPSAGQFFLIERINMFVIASTATSVEFTLGPVAPTDPFANVSVDHLTLVSGVYLYVNDTNHPIYVPESQVFTTSAVGPGVIDTAAVGMVSLQYRVITP